MIELLRIEQRDFDIASTGERRVDLRQWFSRIAAAGGGGDGVPDRRALPEAGERHPPLDPDGHALQEKAQEE